MIFMTNVIVHLAYFAGWVLLRQEEDIRGKSELAILHQNYKRKVNISL